MGTTIGFVVVVLLALAVPALSTKRCRICRSIENSYNSSTITHFMNIKILRLQKNNAKAHYYIAEVNTVFKGPCVPQGTRILLRVPFDFEDPCNGLPAIKFGTQYGVPVTKKERKIGGMFVHNLRPCYAYKEWSALTEGCGIGFLMHRTCDEPSKSPTPTPARTSKPQPKPAPGPTPPSTPTTDCPTFEDPGLVQKNNLNCGVKPTRADIVVRPSDNVRDVVENAPSDSFIFFSRGRFSNGIDDIIPPNGTTLWADPGTVTFEGGSLSTAFTNRRGVVNVRIYGIRFEGYNVEGYRGVINAPTNNFYDTFNAIADPLYGFNPPNGWVVDCCTFQGWTSKERLSVGNAIQCGSGMIIQGNTFLDGEGLGVSCIGKDVTIDGNRFERIQLKDDFDNGHCGAIKLLSNKYSVITNNYFKDIGCKAAWLDINCENIYLAHNEAYNLGRSFLHLEIAGAGTVAEYNKVVGFGWNEVVGDGAWMKSAAFWISTSGGTEARPSEQGNIIRGNYVEQVQENNSTQWRSGFLDLDQYVSRNFDKVSRSDSNEIGHIPDATGSTIPGLKNWSSNYNKFIGNKAIGVYRNGVAATSPTYSRPDQTDTWQCNELEGEFKVVAE